MTRKQIAKSKPSTTISKLICVVVSKTNLVNCTGFSTSLNFDIILLTTLPLTSHYSKHCMDALPQPHWISSIHPALVPLFSNSSSNTSWCCKPLCIFVALTNGCWPKSIVIRCEYIIEVKHEEASNTRKELGKGIRISSSPQTVTEFL